MWSTQWSDLAHEVDRSNLAQAAVWRTAKEFSTVRSFPCQGLFILWQQRMLRTISRKKSYPINVLLLEFERLFVAVAATVCREPHFWTRLRTEGQELFAFLFWVKSPPDTNVSCLLPLGPSEASLAHNADREVFSQRA